MEQTGDRKPERTVRRLAGELRPYSKYLIGGVVFLLLATPAGLIPNLMWMVVVDHVIVERQIQWLAPALGISIGVYLFGLACGAVRDRFFERAGQSFVMDLRLRLFRKLMGQSAAYMHDQRAGDLQSRVVSDVDALQTSLISGFASMVDELYTFILVLGAITVLSPPVGALVFVPLICCFFIARHFNSSMKARYAAAREALGGVGARLHESLGGFLLVKAFARGKQEEEQFREQVGKHFDRTMEAVNLRTIVFPTIFSFAFVTNVIMLGLGGYLVYIGEFTLGGLVALRGFWWQLNSPVRTLAQVNDLIQRALAASDRIYAVLDAPESVRDLPDPKPVPPPPHAIEFRDVSFAYHPGRPVLERVTATVRPGEVVALSGSSGSGKTTLLNLVLRFYDPTSGELFVGDTSLREVRQVDWRRNIAFVLQDTFLFNASVRENIRYGKPDASLEEVIEAAKLANADAFINGLIDGYETVVGERGVKLSGGQKQRIGVARAFIANPEILLLDEPTSAVEEESEQIIQESLIRLMKGRTVLLCSHRPSLIEVADRVLRVDGGRVREAS